MKRIHYFILAAVAVAWLSACGKKIDSESQIREGEILVRASDCKTCHHATNKIIGPSHTDVAKSTSSPQPM